MNKTKRQAIHSSNDAERAPEGRIANRDFDILAMPQLSQLRLQWHNTIREWFDEYAEAVLHNLEATVINTSKVERLLR